MLNHADGTLDLAELPEPPAEVEVLDGLCDVEVPALAVVVCGPQLQLWADHAVAGLADADVGNRSYGLGPVVWRHHDQGCICYPPGRKPHASPA